MPNLRTRPRPASRPSRASRTTRSRPRRRRPPKKAATSGARGGPSRGLSGNLLMQLNAVVLHWPRRASAQRSAAEAARLLKNVAS